MVVGGITRGKPRNSKVLCGILGHLAGRRHGIIVSRLEVRHGQTNFLNEPTVRLSGNDLQLNEDTLRRVDIHELHGRVEERAGQDLMHNRNTIDLVTKDVSENVVTRRIEESVNDLVRGLRLNLLVHNAQNCERCKLVRAQMRQVRCKARCQESVTRREARSVKKPGEQQRAVGVGRQRDRIEDDRGRDSALLVDRDVRALKTRTHAARTESALCDFPHAVDDGVENEVVRGFAEAEAAPKVAESKISNHFGNGIKSVLTG